MAAVVTDGLTQVMLLMGVMYIEVKVGMGGAGLTVKTVLTKQPFGS
jgi:hypothetical protein